MSGRRSGRGPRIGDVIELPAPAKLNLFLHVLGRRPDGYHEIQTVFQFLDLADRVRLARRADTRLCRSAPIPGVAEADDLVIRAGRILRDETGTDAGADIAVEKRIPLGGGLGGGSSDAAATLVGLNRLWGIGMNTDRLAELGVRIGADVPVFVRGLASWAEGVGERLVPLALEEPWYVLIVLPLAVSTAEVFRAPALTRNTPGIRMDALFGGRSGAPRSQVPIERLLAGAHNDCEPLVREMHPRVGDAIDWLSRYSRARMTGTGATVFAPFRSRERAVEIAGAVPAPWWGVVARGMNRSPLLDYAARAAACPASRALPANPVPAPHRQCGADDGV